MNVNEISKRLDQFCLEYKIPKRFHGRLGLLSDMAFVLGAEIEPRVIQPRTEHDALQETER